MVASKDGTKPSSRPVFVCSSLAIFTSHFGCTCGTAIDGRLERLERTVERNDSGTGTMASVQELANALREIPGVEPWLAEGAAEAVACASTRNEAENVVHGYLRDAPMAWKAVERYLESSGLNDAVNKKEPEKRKEKARRKPRAAPESAKDAEDAIGPCLVPNNRKQESEDRKVCGCLATIHKPVGNCLACGRIACEEEGEGICCFCGTYVLRVEEMPKDVVDVARRESTTRVLDDQSDFFESAAG